MQCETNERSTIQVQIYNRKNKIETFDDKVKAHYGVNKNCHNLIVFDTCRILIYHGGCLEKNL